jgi:hypothetical protein
MDVVGSILRGSPALPAGISHNSRSIIEQLLDPQPTTRLGCGSLDAQQSLRSHPFFHGISWVGITSQSAPVPESLNKRLQDFSGLVMVDESEAPLCRPPVVS